MVSGDRRCSSGQPGSRDPQRVRPSSGNSPAVAQTQSSSLCPLHWHHHCFTFSPYFPSLDRLISLDSVRWGPLGLAVRARLVVRKVAGEERVLAACACLPAAPPCAGGDPTTRTGRRILGVTKFSSHQPPPKTVEISATVRLSRNHLYDQGGGRVARPLMAVWMAGWECWVGCGWYAQPKHLPTPHLPMLPDLSHTEFYPFPEQASPRYLL